MRPTSAPARHAVSWLTAGLLSVVVLVGCGGSPDAASTSDPTVGTESKSAPKVTFVELGSRGCIPCDEMQPVMKAIESEFGSQVKVIFYDIREDPAPAQEYGIQFIPTQVFLDEQGVEFHRHTGFYPQEKIEALLLKRGLTKAATP